jgi:hypothetical protein
MMVTAIAVVALLRQFTIASCNMPNENTRHVDHITRLGRIIRRVKTKREVWKATLSIFNFGVCPTTYFIGLDLIINKITNGCLHIRVQVNGAPCAAALQHFLELSAYVLQSKQTKTPLD